MSTGEVYRPFSVMFEELSLTNFDGSKTMELRGVVSQMNIYEDIFTNCVMGDMLVEDTRELIQFFPIVGEETLDIRFRVPTRPPDCAIVFKGMRVYKIGDREATGNSMQKVQKYRLFFMSHEIVTNMNVRVSRSFNTKTASDIVKIIVKDYLDTTKPIEVENSVGTLKTVIPNWNPYRVINWLATDRTKNATNDADFLFFEASNKSAGTKFFYKSIATLLKQEPTFSVEYGLQNVATPGDDPSQHPIFSRSLDDFQFNKHGNLLNNTNSGQYVQHWIYHDPLRKKFVIAKPNHKKDFLKENETSKKFYASKAEKEAKPMQLSRMPGAVNSFPATIYTGKSLDNNTDRGAEPRPLRKNVPYIAKREKADELENTTLIPDCGYRRAFKIQMMNNFGLKIDKISGTDEIMLGKIIKFNKPHISHDIGLINKKSGRFNDRYLSGNYLVTRIRHCIFINSGDPAYNYGMGLEIVRDDFVETISHKDME